MGGILGPSGLAVSRSQGTGDKLVKSTSRGRAEEYGPSLRGKGRKAWLSTKLSQQV